MKSNAGQDAPPTLKENDIIKPSYAQIFERNGITISVYIRVTVVTWFVRNMIFSAESFRMERYRSFILELRHIMTTLVSPSSYTIALVKSKSCTGG